MKVKISLFSIISILILMYSVYPQETESDSAARRFRITSFLLNGQEMSNFEVRFIVKGREITPEREGETILVPDEVYKASWKDSGVRFMGNGFDFTLNNVVMKGYLDSDQVKADYKVRIDTNPLEIERRHISQLTKKEKRSLGIRSYRDVCAVYTFAPTNLTVENSDMIVDPVVTKRFNFCKK
ncbi:MAG: hypothetical protein AB7F88_09870 [Pyrinomonadaceae bacterium]